jgi:plasmid segregation protein ParM
MIVGLDLGYSAVKVVANGFAATFPSVVGTADESQFSAETSGSPVIILHDNQRYFYGDAAVSMSRLESRREDRHWINSDEYLVLAKAAIVQATGDLDSLSIITGLPVSYYKRDRRAAVDALQGLSTISWIDRGMVGQRQFSSVKVAVVPQPFGSLFSRALLPSGRVADSDFLTKPVGVIDVGGKTTNILVANRASEVTRQSASVLVGGWDLVRHLRQALSESCPALELRDHELVRAARDRFVQYYGADVPIGKLVDSAAGSLARSIVSEATHLWGSGANLSAILISGGGANLIGEALRLQFGSHTNVELLPNPEMANAIGYHRYGRFLESTTSD